MSENCQAFTMQETNDSVRLYFKSANNELLTREEAAEVCDVLKDALDKWASPNPSPEGQEK